VRRPREQGRRSEATNPADGLTVSDQVTIKKKFSLRIIKIHWFELALIEEVIVGRREFTKRDLRTRRSKLEEVHAIFNQNTNFDETTLIWLNFDHQSIFVPNLHTKKRNGNQSTPKQSDPLHCISKKTRNGAESIWSRNTHSKRMDA